MTDHLSGAVSGREEAVSSTSLAVYLVDLLLESTIQRSMALFHKIAEEDEANVAESEGRLTFVKLEYLLGGYI